MVHHGVVGVDGLLRVVDVVLVLQLELDGAALGVDLLHSDLSAALGSQAVDGGVTGQGAGAAQLEGGVAGAASAGIGAGTVAAGSQRQRHRCRHGEGKKLFHNNLSLQLDFILRMIYKKRLRSWERSRFLTRYTPPDGGESCVR